MNLTKKNIPVLCLDTCAILDILRDPTREDIRVHEQKASLELLQEAESGTRLQTFIADQVQWEFQCNVRRIQNEADKGFLNFHKRASKLDELASLHGSQSRVDLSHWKGHAKRCRDAADRWMKVGTILPQSNTIIGAAWQRNMQARSPARRGKDSMKDCVILETYYDCVQRLRSKGLTEPAVFVSSNTNDYAEGSSVAIRKDIEDEFKTLELKYAPNMSTAKRFLGL